MLVEQAPNANRQSAMFAACQGHVGKFSLYELKPTGVVRKIEQLFCSQE